MGAMFAIGILNGASDLFSSFIDSVKYPFLRFLVKEEEMEQAIGLNKSVRESIDALGGFLGVLLLSFLGIYKLAFFNAFVFFAVAVGFQYLKRPLASIQEKMPKTQVATPSQVVSQIRKSLKELMQLKELRNFFLLTAAMNSLFMTAMPVFMMFLADNRHVEIIDYGFSVTLIKLILLLAGVAAGILGPKYLAKVTTSQALALAVVCVLGFVLLLGGGLFWPAIAVLSGAAFMAAVFSIRLGAFIYQAVPTEILGTVGGCMNFVVTAFPILIASAITALATASMAAYTVVGILASMGLLVAIWQMKLDKKDFKALLLARYQKQ